MGQDVAHKTLCFTADEMTTGVLSLLLRRHGVHCRHAGHGSPVRVLASMSFDLIYWEAVVDICICRCRTLVSELSWMLA